MKGLKDLLLLGKLENDLAELLQHEYDHLEGILCTMRAMDKKSFKWKNVQNSSA